VREGFGPKGYTMTLEEAITKAREESRNGYVQHVCKFDPAKADARYRGIDVNPNADYIVSDWYDGSTVVSFENGRRL
jgi:hypothetical protein